MDAKRPLDLPELRMWLMDQWKPGGTFHSIAVSIVADQGVEYDDYGTPIMAFEPHVDFECLSRSELWWVTTDMSRLVAAAAKSLLPTTLTDDLLPCDFGMALFEEPLPGTSGDTGNQLAVRILLWGVGQTRGRGARSVGISSYWLHGHDVIPAGRTDWEFGRDTDAAQMQVFADDQLRLDSMSEDRRWLATLWLLAAQPLAETSTAQVTNKAKLRRLQKAKAVRDVRIVNLRTRERTSSGDGRREVNWSHRWIVGGDGGFWRQQAYGPGNAYRKPVFILPFVKGPKDKPLIVRDTVKVLRGDR